jgi:cellulose synthase/poly-beta-1,6-N-acetylglucosamine synthase-like glycosyltransferase
MLPSGGTAICLNDPMRQVEADVEKHRPAFQELFGQIIREEGGEPPRNEAEALPLVSVVLPTKNRPMGLGRALASIQAQDYPAIEVIVINDGGAPVGPLCREHIRHIPLKIVEWPVTKGPGAARNHGIQLATGTYITYLEDDAQYEERHLSWLVTLAQVNARAAFWYAACTEMLYRNNGGKYERLPERRWIGSRGKSGKLGLGDVALISLMHRRTAAVSFPETMACFEDWLFIAQLASTGPGEFQAGNFAYVIHHRRLGDPSQLSENPERTAAALRTS